MDINQLNLNKEFIERELGNNKLATIAYIRKKTGCDLKTAMEYFDSVMNDNGDKAQNNKNDTYILESSEQSQHSETPEQQIPTNCEGCGAPLKYDGYSDKCECEYCGRIYNISQGSYDKNIGNLKSKAKICLKSKNFKELESCCKEILKYKPQDGEAYLMSLEAKLMCSTFEEVLEQISKNQYFLYEDDSTCVGAIEYLDNERSKLLSIAVEKNIK